MNYPHWFARHQARGHWQVLLRETTPASCPAPTSPRRKAGISLVTGNPITVANGALWGAAGWLAVHLLPAIGLPPELPGFPAADLAERQIWWLATVALSTGGLFLLILKEGLGAKIAGLALIVFAPAKPYRTARRIAGLALLLLPHLLGAPHAAIEAGSVPAELAARFAVASLAASALFWAVLGVVTGHVMARLPAAATPGGSPQAA